MKPHPVTFQVKDATLFYKGIYFWVDAGSAHAFPGVCDAASHTGQENSAVWGHQLGQGPLDPNTLVCISSFSSRELHTWPWGLQLGRDGGIFLGFLALGHLPCLTCTWSSWCFHTDVQRVPFKGSVRSWTRRDQDLYKLPSTDPQPELFS